jgi:hypothetical protein
VEDRLHPVLALVPRRQSNHAGQAGTVIAEAIDELDREVSVDSSIVRAHQHAAGGRRQVGDGSDAGGSWLSETGSPNQMITLSAWPAAGDHEQIGARMSLDPPSDLTALFRCR